MLHNFPVNKKYMNKITKIVIGVLALVLVVGLGISNSSNGKIDNNSPKETIKIGIVGPRSGALAFLGDGMNNGAKLAVSEYPNSKYNYEIVFEDDGFDSKRSASVINKLISVDKVDALVTVASASGNIAAPIAERSKIVHFGIASDPTIAVGEYNFIHWTPPFEEAKVFVAELEKRNIKKISLMGAKIQGITAVLDEVKKQASEKGIEVTSEDIFNFGSTDFRTIISKAKSTNPDMYVLIAFSPELEIATKQLNDAGVKSKLTSIEAFELTEKPEIFEGLWYVNAADSNGDFADKFTTTYGKAPTTAAPNTYDIVKFIIEASESNSGKNKPTSVQLVDLLHKTKISGALGSLSIDNAGFVLSKAVVRMIKNGKPVTISN